MNTQLFPRPVGDIGLGAFSAEGPVVTLQDLSQLEIRVTWDEAVSIIEEMCVAAQGAVMRPIPAAGDILLNANGTVTLRHSAAGVPDPVEAARRLHELLGGSVAPAPLRLFVSQAVSSASYGSLSEFDDALAYFAKPGRQDRVKAVYNRASEQVLSNPQSVLEQPRQKASSTPKPKGDAADKPHRSWQRLGLIGLAAASTASAVVTIALFGSSTGQRAAAPVAGVGALEPAVTPEAAGASAAATPAAAKATAAAQPTAATAVTANRDAKPFVSGSAALDAISMPLTGSAAAIGYRGPATRNFRPGSGFGSGFGNGPRTSVPTAAAATLFVEGPPVSQPAAATAGPTGARVQAQAQQSSGTAPATPALAVQEQTLYAAGDTTVQPAVLSKPQILPPPFGSGSGRPVRMELIVSPTGTVERARFLEAPQRMADMMLLSSAKTWIFTPAMKDGRPVRYRAVLSWVGAP